MMMMIMCELTGN